MSAIPSPRSTRPRGSAVLLALFFLMVTFFLALALLELMPLEQRAAGRQAQEAAAYFAADAGIQNALAWLETRTRKGQAILPEGEESTVLSGTTGAWAWRVTIEADPQTPPRGLDPVAVYELRAEALRDGTPFREVRLVARQESFAKYAWFEDQRDTSLYITANVYRFDGPFHSNSKIQVIVPSGYYNSQASKPLFEAECTTAQAHSTADGVNYSGLPPYDAEGNPLPERYQKLYSQGREALRTGVQPVEMPEDATSISAGAMGSQAPLPSSPGVHVPLEPGSGDVAGGVVIVGNADSVVLAVEAGGNRSATIKQGSTTTKVLEVTDTPVSDPSGKPVPVGSTLVVTGGTFSVHPGLTNGTIYATGNINGLQGVNKGKRTVAVDLAAQKEIVLSGSLTRADTPVGQKPAGGRDSLGVVGYKVRVPTSVATSMSRPLNVYAGIFAGSKGTQGGLYIDNWSGRSPSVVHLHGGLSMSYKPAWHSLSYGGQLLSGVTLESHYDPNLASSPPPYFPTIGKFRVVSYEESNPQAP